MACTDAEQGAGDGVAVDGAGALESAGDGVAVDGAGALERAGDGVAGAAVNAADVASTLSVVAGSGCQVGVVDVVVGCVLIVQAFVCQ